MRSVRFLPQEKKFRADEAIRVICTQTLQHCMKEPADLKATVNLSGMQLGTYTGTLNMGGLGKNFKLLSVSAFSVEVTAGGPAAQLDQTTADEEEADEEDSAAENSNTKIQDTETSGANAG